jgi:rare lipoprotein A
MSGKYLILISVFVFACSSSPKFTIDKNDNNNSCSRIDSLYYNNPVPVDTITGVASYYADKFHGRTTANGETYDMYGFTAAHYDMPFDTIIRVVNLKNDKFIIIRINDRMPYHSERIIDLSYGTALELDMVKDGIQEVRLEILEWGEE